MLFFIFLVFIKIQYDNLFIFWIILSSSSILLYFLDFDVDIYNKLLAFGFYAFLVWIIDYLLNLYLNLDRIISNHSIFLLNLISVFFIIFFVFSFYYSFLLNYLVYSFFVVLFIFNYLDFNKFFIDNKSSIYHDFLIFWVFLLIIIPFVNDFLLLESKNLLLWLISLWFLICYIWFNLLARKKLKA